MERGVSDTAASKWRHQNKIARDLIAREMATLGHFVGGRVLDVGSGGASYRQFFAPDTTTVTFDISLYGRPTVIGSALEMPFRSASFDSVVSTQTLEHLANPFRAISEMNRVLKPSGCLLITAPQTWPEHMAPHDYFRFTRFGLEQVMHESGLAIEQFRPCGGFFATLGQMMAQRTYQVATTYRRHLVRRFLRRVLIPLINRIALRLDTRSEPNDDTVLNWIVVARKLDPPINEESQLRVE